MILLLYFRYYAEACNRWRDPSLWRLGSTVPKKRRRSGVGTRIQETLDQWFPNCEPWPTSEPRRHFQWATELPYLELNVTSYCFCNIHFTRCIIKDDC